MATNPPQALPLEYPSSFQEKPAFDPAKINPMGVGKSREVTQAYEDALKAQKDLADRLEQRFAQPNWWKIAAGFAKPQLGGFLASLGSASEAMGQQVEAQRAIAPTIARMRAEIAAGQLPLAQRREQVKILDKAKSENRPLTPDEIQEVTAYGESDIAKAAMDWHRQAQARLDLVQRAVGAMGKDPNMPFQDFAKLQMTEGADPKKVQDAQKSYEDTLNNSRPPQIEPAQWAAMPRYDKMEAVTQYARAQREAGSQAETALQQSAQQAPSQLSLLGSIRDLAMGVGLKETTDPKTGKVVTGQQQMDALLGMFTGSNPIEVIARAAADGKLGDKLAEIDKYARQLQMSPQALDQFQKLMKLLAENQMTLRNGTVNPTDASMAMQQLSSPNIGNTQRALVTLTDLMAHGAQHAISKYQYVVQNKVPFRMLGIDEGYLGKLRDYAQQHRQIATQSPTVELPAWYSPTYSPKPLGGAQTFPVPSASPSAPAAPAAAAPTPARTAPPSRPAERKIGNQTWVRQADGSWRLKEQ